MVEHNSPFSDSELATTIMEFRSSVPKRISMFWLLRKLFKRKYRESPPPLRTSMYQRIAKSVARQFRDMTGSNRGGQKRITVSEDDLKILSEHTQI